MQRLILASFLLFMVSACAVFGPTGPDVYPVFFVPRTSDLTPEAQQIVRQAAANAQRRKLSKIEIAVPPPPAGGAQLAEGRYTAIQNIISATGIDTKLFSRAPLSMSATALAGGTDRAEIRFVP
jgi:hypothetical protein